MERKEFIKLLVINYFLIQSGISLAIGTIGCIYAPEIALSYDAFFMPFIYAFFCVLPSILTYSSQDLSIREMIVREVLEFVMVEVVVLILTYLSDAWLNPTAVLTIAFSVAIVYVFVLSIDYSISHVNAKRMSAKLKQMRQKEGEW